MFGFGKKVPYRIGLALSGGGARGFAHAGAIKALLEVGVVPDVVAGVSAGSVVAVMYAAGMKPDDMIKAFADANFSDFCDIRMPRDGFFRIDKFGKYVSRLIKPYHNIEDLPVKTFIGATDIDRGIPVAFDSGSIAERVVASCSIPIVFKPVKVDGVRYVDGGVLHNLPAWMIRDQCKFLIGINCSPISQGEPVSNIVGVAMRSYELMSKNNAQPDMDLCDMVIRTEGIAHYKVFNLRNIDRVYESGYNDTMNFLIAHGFNPRR